MKKIILHIGPHKTGTTFLQKIFFENKSILAKEGVDYLDFGMVHFGHHKIPEFLNKKKYKVGELTKAINKSKCNTILLSSENFDLLRPYSISFLKNELADFKVEVVLFYRMSTDRLFSWWQEEVKHGGTNSYYDYSVNHYAKPFLSPILNTSLLVDFYAEYFGLDSIRLFDYDYCKEQKGILHEFQQYLGITNNLEVENKKINQRLAVEDVELIRILNLIAKKNGTLHAHNVRDAYLKGRANNTKLINQICSILEHDLIDISTGNTFIDRILKNNFIKKYNSNFCTETDSSFKETLISLPNTNWPVDEKTLQLINELYQCLRI